MGDKNKKGQVTIFIILGIVIVLAGVLIFTFYPQIKSTLTTGEESPQAFMKTCLEEETIRIIENLSLQGGSVNPEAYFNYNGDHLEYLCYTNEPYLTCTVQQPMMLNHVKSEIKREITPTVNSCLDSMKKSFEGKGYSVNLENREFDVEIVPDNVVYNFNVSLDLQKADTQRTYDRVIVAYNRNLYEMLLLVSSIINWEAKFGDSETTIYMSYYRDFKVEKFKQTDGTTVYTITERDKDNVFRFASRSLAWPPGYGTSQMRFN